MSPFPKTLLYVCALISLNELKMSSFLKTLLNGCAWTGCYGLRLYSADNRSGAIIGLIYCIKYQLMDGIWSTASNWRLIAVARGTSEMNRRPGSPGKGSIKMIFKNSYD